MIVGRLTRGTTNPNRLRRVDRWIASRFGRTVGTGTVVDLGYGATPVTTVELHRCLPHARVVGLEIDPVRVADAQPFARPPGLTFARGGFELAGLRPVLVRTMNVLRQYDESEVDSAWALLRKGLAPGGVLVEGTCDELGRVASWVTLSSGGPLTLTLAGRLSTLDDPAIFAERLPKALIHRNVPGERVHDLFLALDRHWARAAPYAAFGARQRWVHTVAGLRADGWPVLDRPARWRHGELTLAWAAVQPRDDHGTS
ncbi:hypothetical protein Val02_54980 [Virgisporangium aliadipatigenens]|uniref:SAM-dependent methyltransferase n=1 Tax=Virgisporangium aliadipatigenens TaxID=741659 RepID=A0A8J4DTX7_9ACTN|nr:class I SAM-dependent methyltransferase [Virgisporangium aliadipatigenens]GIJ48612.1 hypothetical protein Val02_54980 [Virgisporangium aliadipatigenens]